MRSKIGPTRVARGIYEALIARCAVKAAADAVYTWNLRHFAQFGAAIAARLKTP